MKETVAIGTSGVNAISQNLRETLQDYIEAQYHIRDEDLIVERRALLEEVTTIYQQPYLEATPSYKVGASYSGLQIPESAKRVLTELSTLGVGLYPRPYVHQADILEAFLGRLEDVVVATGTGSGKTEGFLMPIIGSLAMEAVERPAAAKMDGCRAVLLYPMNALVNDQLARVRRIFGDQEASRVIAAGRGRPVRFATYTGRSPYPGRRSSARDRALLAPLFDEYYIPLLERPELVDMLRVRGRWPSKDILAFFNAQAATRQTFKSGKKRAGKEYTRQNWHLRFKTSEADRELLTRDEVQLTCPDLLITNYSMLEYMMMRPIERVIFERTRDWLHSDKQNKLILVVDEAHMYTGAAGAEVALLIRRLTARLEIPRDRLRCILTSASIGNDNSQSAGAQFAINLTGGLRDTNVTFIKGTLEERSYATPGRAVDVAEVLAACTIERIEGFAIEPEAAAAELLSVSAGCGWDSPQGTTELGELRDYLFQRLTGFPVAERLLNLTAGKAVKLDELASDLFPDSVPLVRQRALAALVSLCCFARRASDGKVFLPARLHLFFRGLPGLYACIDPNCTSRRHRSATSKLGRLYAEPRLICQCDAAGRVYEVYTHRDCGAAFIRAYINGWDGTFLWSEPSEAVGERLISPLSPIELLVDGAPHPDEIDVNVRYLDISSGRIFRNTPASLDGFRIAYVTADHGDDLRFKKCPVCLKRWQGVQSKLMDHRTKGEDPFAALVTAQLHNQPATEPVTRQRPNGGRKVLLFSDGRQKAARLARDIPRAAEQDVFRAIIALAARRLTEIGREARPDTNLYVAFLSVLVDSNVIMFDGDDRAQLEQHVSSYDKRDFDDLAEALDEYGPAVQPPARYTKALLTQLCSEFYSLSGVTVGYVQVAQRQMRRLLKQAATGNLITKEAADLEPLAFAWIDGLLGDFAFGPTIPEYLRRLAAGYARWPWGSKGKFAAPLRRTLLKLEGWSEAAVRDIEQLFADTLAAQKEQEGLFLDSGCLAIVVDLKATWLQCAQCTALSPVSFRNSCIQCGHGSLKSLDPSTSPYLRARKGYWRGPIESLLQGTTKLQNASVEEHTAQLSHRDRGSAYSTTESYELRFQDILINSRDRPIDILSCTTTMEVGIDIGQLVAVGLRNVPPQRSNYQQRAGRAGRRGSSVSTVITFAQNGPHDSFYFNAPSDIIAGTPKTPDLKIDNPKIARRHIHAFLLQTYFNEAIEKRHLVPNADTSSLFKALGMTSDFFYGEGPNRIGLDNFGLWVEDRVVREEADLSLKIASWLPDAIKVAPLTKAQWIRQVALTFLTQLRDLKPHVDRPDRDSAKESNEDDEDEAVEDPFDDSPLLQKEQLLDFLFDHNMLPSYAFPTNLSGFLIEEVKKVAYGIDVRVREQPQQSMDKALSEYAPGRLVVINKQTYRAGGVVANVSSSTVDRGAPLFAPGSIERLEFCSACSYVGDTQATAMSFCKVCGSRLESHDMLQPALFTPENGRALREDDRDQEFTYATMAQFPVPLEDEENFTDIGVHAKSSYTNDRRLLIVNKGSRARDGYGGFNVCELCGSASSEPRTDGPHDRPYLVSTRGTARVQRCIGSFRKVYIGSVFSSDVLLLRLEVSDPVLFDTKEPNALSVLEDASITVSQALALSAARHAELDIDPRELGSGYRIIPSADSGRSTILDIYLYDTSAGGAGYSEMAGRHIKEILSDTINALEGCAGGCDRSCQNCLRHFHNQHIQERLDRLLGSDLLRYVLHGEVPKMRPSSVQARSLTPLKRYLELEGFWCETDHTRQGKSIPLMVRMDNRELAVGVRPGLLSESASEIKQWEDGLRGIGVQGLAISDFLLLRDLPDVQRLISATLGP